MKAVKTFKTKKVSVKTNLILFIFAAVHSTKNKIIKGVHPKYVLTQTYQFSLVQNNIELIILKDE